MIIVACIVVWVCLYFAKRHVEKKTAMSKAYYRRAREGIPNNIDVEVGLQSKNPYTVQLAPYRYMSRNKEVNMVRPKKAMRTGRAQGKLQGTEFYVHHKSPSRRSVLSINGYNNRQRQLSAKQTKKQKKQKQKQKRKGKGKGKGSGKGQDPRHEQEEPKQPSDNGWNQLPDQPSRHSNQGWTPIHSNRGSHAGTEQHEDHHDKNNNNNNSNNNNEQEGFVSWDHENHDNNHDHGHHDTGGWTQHAEEEHRSHHGSTNMPGGWDEWQAHHNDDHGNHESQKW